MKKLILLIAFVLCSSSAFAFEFTPGQTSGVVFTSAIRSFTSTTAATSTDLTWPVAANKAYSFICNLSTTSTSTSMIRIGIDAPASTVLNFSAYKFTTSATTGVFETVAAQWVTPCTNCTTGVTSGVLTSATEWQINGTAVPTADGNITILGATSAGDISNSINRGSSCMWWREN